jgi:hypothetical protein
MNKSLVLLVAIVTFNQSLSAQETTIPKLRLGIETGADVFFGKTDKPAMIRETRSSSYYYNNHDYYSSVYDFQDVSFFHFGIKPEYTFSKRFTVAAGLRFSFSASTLESDRDYFFWKVNETETTTNYLRINEINQTNYYLGIPMEIRYFLHRKKYFGFILGTSYNFLLASTDDVRFVNADMKKYASNVKENLEKPDFFQGCVYAGFGVNAGRAHHPHVSFEFYFPTIMYGRKGKTNSFTKTEGGVSAGFGMRVALQIPFFFKEQSVIN